MNPLTTPNEQLAGLERAKATVDAVIPDAGEYKGAADDCRRWTHWLFRLDYAAEDARRAARRLNEAGT